VLVGADFRISPVRVLDAPDGEAGVSCVPVLLMHVPKLVREDVNQRLSTVAQHQLPTLVLSVRLLRSPDSASLAIVSGRSFSVLPDFLWLAPSCWHPCEPIGVG
jgi:hypothetical protein